MQSKRNTDFSPSEMPCSFMDNPKVNYDELFTEEINKIKQKEVKPTLLLHVCCAPCFTYPFTLLKDYFKISIIFNNSNIYPEREYQRRLDELKTYLRTIKADVSIIEVPYDNQNFVQDLLPYSNQREGMDRCRLCFQKRLSQAFAYAQENHFDYCGTVMSISRFKNSQTLNAIGLDLAKNSSTTKWLPADFKKNGGYEKSLKIVKEFGLYFQRYCGCQFSIKEQTDTSK